MGVSTSWIREDYHYSIHFWEKQCLCKLKNFGSLSRNDERSARVAVAPMQRRAQNTLFQPEQANKVT